MRRDNVFTRLIDYRRMAVDIIELMHKFYSYKDISTMLGIPPSMISRYLHRHSLPGKNIAEKIINNFIANSKISKEIANLIRKNPDLLYNDVVANTLLLLTIRKFANEVINADVIISFNDPSISLAMKLSDAFMKNLVVLYFAPIVPGTRAECFSIATNPIAIFACTRYDALRTRASHALLVFPLVINVEAIGTICERIRSVLKIKEVIPLIIVCGSELKKYGGMSIKCILER